MAEAAAVAAGSGADILDINFGCAVRKVVKTGSGVALMRTPEKACAVIEAVRNAIKLYGQPVTGEKVKKGYEHIKDFSLGGFLPPMEITPEDHEGGGWVRAYQWDGEKFVLAKDWYKAHRDIIKAHLEEVAKAQ